ncbi:MAG TPA: hypothetical protein VE734_05800, partial [Terriglobales bacterium]|nr:hypothetical protein [Terriglobales bacterium]
VALRRSSSRSELTLKYLGGGTVANRQALANGQTELNAVLQQLEATQSLKWRRWALLVGDQFSYLPQSSFGLLDGSVSSFGTGLGSSLGQLPSLQSFLSPNQSVLSGRGGRVSNTFLTQGGYHLTARSSLTIAGAYGLLRFFDSDLLDSYNAMLVTGYSRQISGRDTLGVAYRFNAFRFTGLNQAVDNHVAELAYGRRVTGRLALRLAAGPEVDVFRDSGVAKQSRPAWSLESALHSRLSRTALDLSYQRGLTGGAGVLAGAETNQVEATMTRGLWRVWQSSLGLGYAKNRNVAATAVSPLNRNFNTWYGRVQFRRPIGRGADQFIAYALQLQKSDTSFCAGSVCASSVVRHQLSIGFNWHHRPIAIK